MRTLFSDLRHAFRLLVTQPGLTIVALVTLTLGIGANSTIFSVVHGVLLKPLPYPEADRLQMLFERNLNTGGQRRVAADDFVDWQRDQRSFEALAGYIGTGFTFSGDSGEPELVIGQQVSAELFDILRVPPLLGRTLRAEENESGRDRVMVLSHALWQRRFAGDPTVIDRLVTVNARPYTIVGVMPPGFDYPARRYELWTPFPFRGAQQTGMPPVNRDTHYLQVLGRLRPDVTPVQARQELQALAASTAARFPDSHAQVGADLISLTEQTVGDIRPALLALFGAVLFVLLLACANVMHLQLAQATRRERELAIRMTLGASRARIVRQLLTEHLLLALLGAGAGLLLATWLLQGLLALAPRAVPRLDAVTLDTPIVLFTIAIATASAMAFGLVPALQLLRTNLSSTLLSVGRGSTMGRRGRWIRAGLIVGEVALSLMLVAGAGLMLRSFVRLQQVDKGFDTARVLTFGLAMPGTRYPDAPRLAAFSRALTEKLGAMGELEASGFTTHLPLTGQDIETGFTVEGRPTANANDVAVAGMRGISPAYFETMGIRVVRGRPFGSEDRVGAPPVAVVNETFVRRYLAGRDPIGRRVRAGSADGTDGWMTVVGVVADVKHRGLMGAARPEIYQPYDQLSPDFMSNWARGLSVVVRTRAEQARVAGSLRAALRALDPAIPLYELQPMDALVTDAVAEPRFRTLLIGLFGLLALTLAAVGIFGVISFLVSQRTREIGIRIALGAPRAHVAWRILREASLLIGAGLIAGLAAAWWLTRYVEAQLYGVTRGDVWTLALCVAALAVVALLATLVPAGRAARIEPFLALRSE